MTAREKLNSINAKIDKYLASKRVKLIDPPEVEGHLDLSPEIIRCMTVEECGESSFLLAQYAYYLRQRYNLAVMRMQICDGEIDKQISRKVQSYDKFMKWEEKRMAAINEDSHASAWLEIRKWAEAEATMQHSLAADVREMSKVLSRIMRTKHGKIKT